LEGYNRPKEKDLVFLGVNLLVEIDKLRVRLVKIVDQNNMNYKMSGIGGDDPRNSLTEEVRTADPQTFRMLQDAVLEPARKDLFFKAVALLIKVKNIQCEYSRRVFFADHTELNQI